MSKLDDRAAGFTLIELLVVIAIIGLLASVVLSAVSTARIKARDAQRLSEIHELQTALQLYFTDKGYHPACARPSNDLPGSIASMNCLATILVPKYIQTMPQDPNYPNASYAYDQWCATPSGGGSGYYRLWMKPENAQGIGNWWSDNYFGVTTCESAGA